MIVHNCEQGSEEWHALRLGMPTASNFKKLVTPKTLEFSKQAVAYIDECAAELMLGEPLDSAASPWIERGHRQEEDGIRWYEFEAEVPVQRVGFVTDDEATVGCSPDGLIHEDHASGGIEVKALSAAKHVAVLRDPDSFVAGHHLQCQGGLWICERDYWILLAWHPDMPCVVRTIERDEEIIEKLATAVALFNEKLNTFLVEHGYREPAKATA